MTANENIMLDEFKSIVPHLNALSDYEKGKLVGRIQSVIDNKEEGEAKTDDEELESD